MFRCYKQKNRVGSRVSQRRLGLSLMELLIAVSIMSGIAASVGAVAMAVQTSNDYNQSHDLAVQHGRVALLRIRRTIREATFTDDFPGFASFSEFIGPWEFPDTLVVWHPQKTASNPQGLPANVDGPPLFEELVIFAPDPNAPDHFLEITLPGDNQPVPDWSDTAFWSAELVAIKTSDTVKKVVLTDHLRVAQVSDASLSLPEERGVAQFLVRPTRAEWDAFNSDADPLTWTDVYGQQRGVRQSWCEIEFQLESKTISVTPQTIPFFGSAAVYFQ